MNTNASNLVDELIDIDDDVVITNHVNRKVPVAHRNPNKEREYRKDRKRSIMHSKVRLVEEHDENKD
jgi:hypothetical protein